MILNPRKRIIFPQVFPVHDCFCFVFLFVCFFWGEGVELFKGGPLLTILNFQLSVFIFMNNLNS